MNLQDPRSLSRDLSPGGVVIVEACAGQPRRELLRQQLAQAAQGGATPWLLECRRDLGGPWAGLRDLLLSLIPDIKAQRFDLLRKHDYELALAVPELQRDIQVSNPNLTDISSGGERTRNYAADRAYRIPHGLIDLLDAWRPHTNGAPWVIACDDYDQCGPLVRMFFSELMRRRGKKLNLTVWVAVAPGQGEPTAKMFDATVARRVVTMDLEAEPGEEALEPKTMASQARALAPLATDRAGVEVVLPRLTYYWLHSDEPVRALYSQIQALDIFTTRGFYEDAVVYGEAAQVLLDRFRPDDLSMRMVVLKKLSNCYAALGRPEDGVRMAEEAMRRTDDPQYLYSWCYMLAMSHARYLPKRDLARAEAYLQQGLRYIEQADLPLHTRLFQTAFNRNGVALLRHFQKRYAEAIELCRTAFDELNRELGQEEYLLHRSVLVYNVAQVYAAMGQTDESIRCFSTAIQMDPNYSEYYNERGSLYLKTERYEEAIADFQRAIELSPPYMEVWVNLGQCFGLSGRPEEAVAAYSRALDLAPRHSLALVGRAQAYEEVAQPEQALSDYTAALEVQANQALVLGARAVLHYSAGRLTESLADLDRAIQLEPDAADLYQNRAVALTDLGRLPEAVRDLQTYLVLSPDAEDRPGIDEKLVGLQAQLALAASPPVSPVALRG